MLVDTLIIRRIRQKIKTSYKPTQQFKNCYAQLKLNKNHFLIHVFTITCSCEAATSPVHKIEYNNYSLRTQTKLSTPIRQIYSCWYAYFRWPHDYKGKPWEFINNQVTSTRRKMSYVGTKFVSNTANKLKIKFVSKWNWTASHYLGHLTDKSKPLSQSNISARRRMQTSQTNRSVVMKTTPVGETFRIPIPVNHGSALHSLIPDVKFHIISLV